MTRDEAIKEASDYALSNRGRYVENPYLVHSFGSWSTCEVKRTECQGTIFFWKTALLMRQRQSVSEEEFNKLNAK